jgi:hypothetical protein
MKFDNEMIQKYYGDNCKVTTIDFEEVVVKTIDDTYEVEISAYKKPKQNLYLWKNHKELVGTILGLAICNFNEGLNMFNEVCIKNGKYLHINFDLNKRDGGTILITDLKEEIKNDYSKSR